MQRTRNELDAMTHADLVDRVLELQDMLREGLAVRESLHAILNQVLAANEEAVLHYADLGDDAPDEELEKKRAWAAARLAVADPQGAAKRRTHDD